MQSHLPARFGAGSAGGSGSRRGLEGGSGAGARGLGRHRPAKWASPTTCPSSGGERARHGRTSASVFEEGLRSEREKRRRSWTNQASRRVPQATRLEVSRHDSVDTFWWESLDEVYVIATCTQEGCVEERGFYANRADLCDEYGRWMDVLIAFECREDAQRHKGLISAEDGAAVSLCVEALLPSALKAVAVSLECGCSLQRKGTLLLPPDRAELDSADSARDRLERRFGMG